MILLGCAYPRDLSRGLMSRRLVSRACMMLPLFSTPQHRYGMYVVRLRSGTFLSHEEGHRALYCPPSKLVSPPLAGAANIMPPILSVPVELGLQLFELLPLADLFNFSVTSRASRQLSLHAIFRTLTLGHGMHDKIDGLLREHEGIKSCIRYFRLAFCCSDLMNDAGA